MEIFKCESIITFFDRFKTDMDCLEYLAEKKLSLVLFVKNVNTINVQFERKTWLEIAINVII